MYSVGLSIYYFYLIKRNMREREFRKAIEPYLHGVPILWTLVGSTYGLVAHMYNPGDVSECFIAAKPRGCDKNDEIDCERGEDASTFAVIYIAFPILICFFVALGALLRTYWTIRSQELSMNKYRLNMVSRNLSLRVSGTEQKGTVRGSLSRMRSFLRVSSKGEEGPGEAQEQISLNHSHGEGESSGVLAVALANRKKTKCNKSKGREILVLSAQYVTGFALTYIMTFVGEWYIELIVDRLAILIYVL